MILDDFEDVSAKRENTPTQKDNSIIPFTNPFTNGLSAKADDIENAISVSLIDGFMEYNKVSILYGESGSGKSLLTLSLCVRLLENSMINTINYYDFDNPLSDQKDRGIHKLIRRYKSKFNYINLETMDKKDLTPEQVLDGLLSISSNDTKVYENQFFVFDTMGELVSGSLGDDKVVRPLLDKLKKLRSMGATIQIIHHTTKAKEDVTFFGSNYFKVKIDAMWLLTSKSGVDRELEFALELQKNRSGNLKNTAFTVNPTTHTIKDGNYLLASMSDDESEIVADIRVVLSECEQIAQGNLLKHIGKDEKDKKSIKLLKKYDGVMWDRLESASYPKTVSYRKLTNT